MNILSKLFKKRQQPTSSDNFKVVPNTKKELPEEQTTSSDKFEVVLKTKRELSEEQKNAIITIVKDGILSGAQLSDIAINIMFATGIYEPVIMIRIENGVEVSI